MASRSSMLSEGQASIRRDNSGSFSIPIAASDATAPHSAAPDSGIAFFPGVWASVRVLSPPLVLTVAKLAYRRVIRKAGVPRRRPFRVLSPVLAISYGHDTSLRISSRPVARDPRTLNRLPDPSVFGRNSRLSLCLSPPGLTGVAFTQLTGQQPPSVLAPSRAGRIEPGSCHPRHRPK